MKIGSINAFSFAGRIKKGDIAKKADKTRKENDMKISDALASMVNCTQNSESKPELVSTGLTLVVIPLAGSVKTLSEI